MWNVVEILEILLMLGLCGAFTGFSLRAFVEYPSASSTTSLLSLAFVTVLMCFAFIPEMKDLFLSFDGFDTIKTYADVLCPAYVAIGLGAALGLHTSYRILS
jgi:hypothetical protein